MDKKLKIKQIKIGINISDHDLKNKINKADKLINKGNQVKFSIEIRGRQSSLLNKEDILKKLNLIITPYKKINIWNKGDNYYALVKKK